MKENKICNIKKAFEDEWKKLNEEKKKMNLIEQQVSQSHSDSQKKNENVCKFVLEV